MSSAAVTAIENQRTLLRTGCFRVRHRATALAREARAKSDVQRKRPKDQTVKLPRRLSRSLVERRKMPTDAARLRTAMSGQRRMARSAGRGGVLKRAPV